MTYSSEFKEEAQNIYCLKFYNKFIPDVVPFHLKSNEFKKRLDKFYPTYKKAKKDKSEFEKYNHSYKKYIERMKFHQNSNLEKVDPKSKNQYDHIFNKRNRMEMLIDYVQENNCISISNIKEDLDLSDKDVRALIDLGYLRQNHDKKNLQNRYAINYSLSECLEIALLVIEKIKEYK